MILGTIRCFGTPWWNPGQLTRLERTEFLCKKGWEERSELSKQGSRDHRVKGHSEGDNRRDGVGIVLFGQASN